MRRVSISVALLLLAMLAFHRLAADEGSLLFNSSGGFTADPRMIKELDRLVSQQQQSMRYITIRDANLFHKRFIDRCMGQLPDEVTIEYVGLLGTDNGRRKTRIVTDDVLGALSWHVQTDLVIFDMWISTMRTKETVVKCSIENRDVFVNVLGIDDGRGLDEKLPELGGHSVTELLSLLEIDTPKKKQESKQ